MPGPESHQHLESFNCRYVCLISGYSHATDSYRLGYWAFLDFALAFIPIDMVWKLQLSLKKKLALSCLLGMGVLYVQAISRDDIKLDN